MSRERISPSRPCTRSPWERAIMALLLTPARLASGQRGSRNPQCLGPNNLRPTPLRARRAACADEVPHTDIRGYDETYFRLGDAQWVSWIRYSWDKTKYAGSAARLIFG